MDNINYQLVTLMEKDEVTLDFNVNCMFTIKPLIHLKYGTLNTKVYTIIEELRTL